jgi:hypothetical protein
MAKSLPKSIVAAEKEKLEKLLESFSDKLCWRSNNRTRVEFDLSDVEAQSGDHPLIEVRPDDTAIVSTKDRFRVVLHTGEFNPETGVEILYVGFELADADLAMELASDENNLRKRDGVWCEVLTYEEVFDREHGELPEQAKAERPKRKPRAAKPRIAAVA